MARDKAGNEIKPGDGVMFMGREAHVVAVDDTKADQNVELAVRYDVDASDCVVIAAVDGRELQAPRETRVSQDRHFEGRPTDGSPRVRSTEE